MRLTAALLGAFSIVMIANAQDDVGKKEAAKFAGTWTVLERNEKKVEKRKWILKDGKIIDQRGEKSRDGKYEIDVAKKHIDLVGEKAVFVGIYEWIDGGKKLKICGAEVPDGKKKEDVRPKEIALKKGVIVFVLEKGM
jgi:hypothetical protein